MCEMFISCHFNEDQFRAAHKIVTMISEMNVTVAQAKRVLKLADHLLTHESDYPGPISLEKLLAKYQDELGAA